MATETFQGSDRQRAYSGLLEETIQRAAHADELSQATRRELTAAAAEIARLKDDFVDMQRSHGERFRALAAEHGRETGLAHRGVFETREQARHFGLVAIASSPHADDKQRAAARAELQKAAVDPTTGTRGGYLLPEFLVPGIIRNVEAAGVFERNSPPLPVPQLAGGWPKGTGGATVYYPDFGDAPTESELAFGRVNFNCKRHSVYVLVDRWMLMAEMAVALGEYVAKEMGYALALAQDTNWFIGDGASPSGYTGLLNDATIKSHTPTADLDEFQEILDVSSQELGKLLGMMPAYVTMGPNAKWYMHTSAFFGFLSVRDTAGMPIAHLYASGQKWGLGLMGYPVELTQVLPAVGGADDGASKPMLLFGDLEQACRVFRFKSGIELRTSEHVKFAEGQLAMVLDVWQDRVVADENAIGRLITHS